MIIAPLTNLIIYSLIAGQSMGDTFLAVHQSNFWIIMLVSVPLMLLVLFVLIDFPKSLASLQCSQRS
ncbi:MAG: hypothetical protein MK098_12255 [Marinovum sp.]|nr:hypothetical protein [Marinovum sp.]